jgi:hypothetical protein
MEIRKSFAVGLVPDQQFSLKLTSPILLYFPQSAPMTGILTAGDCSEALLSSCIPYLKLDPLIVDEDLFDFEVNPGGTRTVSTSRVTSVVVLLSTLQPH